MGDLEDEQLELPNTLPKIKDPDSNYRPPQTKDFIAYEELRRDLLKRAVMTGIYLSLGFFVLAALWVVCFAYRSENSWHILLLLILPPTTLLFAIFKAFQKQETEATNIKNISSTAFADELVDIIKRIVAIFR